MIYYLYSISTKSISKSTAYILPKSKQPIVLVTPQQAATMQPAGNKYPTVPGSRLQFEHIELQQFNAI